MTIKEAIAVAKNLGEWSVVKHEPTSVNVGFIETDNFRENEVQLDTWGDDHEAELESVWNDLCREFGSSERNVLYVHALGYIA